MKFRNFLASVMAGCAHGHAGWSLIPSPRLGVPMETGSKLISGLKCCYVCILFVFVLNMFPLAWAHPASAGSLVAEGPTLWSEWVAAAVYKSRGERDSPLQDVRRNRSTLKDFRADPPFPTNPTIRTVKNGVAVGGMEANLSELYTYTI